MKYCVHRDRKVGARMTVGVINSLVIRPNGWSISNWDVWLNRKRTELRIISYSSRCIWRCSKDLGSREKASSYILKSWTDVRELGKKSAATTWEDLIWPSKNIVIINKEGTNYETYYSFKCVAKKVKKTEIHLLAELKINCFEPSFEPRCSRGYSPRF